MPDVSAKQVMKKGSLSFYLASRLLPRKVREPVTLLYQWCRYCDDQIDGQELGHGGTGSDGSTPADLLAATEGALKGREQGADVFRSMGQVLRDHSIPFGYAKELIEGMQMDADGTRYETVDDLRKYCYRVAGTVGLMFAHVSGVSSPTARRHAAELGMAMQLTNIARDVAEDWAKERIYLPLSWLREAGVPQDRLLEPPYRRGLCDVVRWMLDDAARLYRSGDAGLIYLPWRVAFAVAAARHIYADIGRKVLELGHGAWDQRARVSLARKLWLVGRAFFQVAATLPARIRHPWRAAPLAGEWRLT